jgi:hypothetical protein
MHLFVPWPIVIQSNMSCNFCHPRCLYNIPIEIIAGRSAASYLLLAAATYSSPQYSKASHVSSPALLLSFWGHLIKPNYNFCSCMNTYTQLASRVRHRYTAGRVFPHRTRTHTNRTRTGYGYIPYRNFHGIPRNPRYTWYPRFFLILSYVISTIYIQHDSPLPAYLVLYPSPASPSNHSMHGCVSRVLVVVGKA